MSGRIKIASHRFYAVQFADNARKAAHAQAFFHRGQDLGVLPGLAEDDAVGVKAEAGKRGREKIPAVKTGPGSRARMPAANRRAQAA